MRIALIVLVLPLLLSGCLEQFKPPPRCPDPDLWTLFGPLAADGNVQHGFTVGPAGLAWSENTFNHSARVHLQARTLPNSQSLYPETIAGGAVEGVPPGFLVFAALRQREPEKSIESLLLESTLYDASFGSATKDECRGVGTTTKTIEFADASSGPILLAGQGALVHTAGFWTNGTMFYTNMQRVHDDARIPRAGWYEFESADPLKVYVYNQSRTELPKRYNESGYSTTILGFNEALKRMETTSSRVVRIEPTRAYTRPGNEKHALYGDALVFYIEFAKHAIVPCRVPQPLPFMSCPDV